MTEAQSNSNGPGVTESETRSSMRESEVCIAFSAFVRGLMNDVLCISGSSSSTPWPFVPSCGDSIYNGRIPTSGKGE